MSLKRKSRSLGQLAGLGASNLAASKNIPSHKSGLLKGHDEVQKKVSRTTPKRLKGLVRPRPSSTTPLGKSVFGRSTPKQGNSEFLLRSHLNDIMNINQAQILPNRNRSFIMDTQIMYSVGLQCQERSLFLFSDMLLIAKERSSNFKLKDQVPLSDLWLSTCISDVSEVTLDSTRSFVIGWPITNAAITFSSSSQKEIWWDKLNGLIKQERRQNPPSTNIQLGYFDQATNFEHVKNICARREDTANDCIVAALKVLDSPDLKPTDLQLWVRTKPNESPYPLIGHEVPLVIKLHCMKKNFEGPNQKSFEDYKIGARCSFILRKTGPVSLPSPSQKYTLKKVTSSIRLQNVFRRVSHGSTKQSDADQMKNKKDVPTGKIFGHPLERVPCGKDGVPKAMEQVLLQLLDEGPSTVGIFRRSPNARAMREMRSKIDDEETVDFKECSVFVTAALLKDFLRSLPDSLLPSDTFSIWNEMTKDSNTNEKVASSKRLLSKLSSQSFCLLKHVVYILKEIAIRSQENMMTSSNIAICVGPCLLRSADTQVVTGAAYASDVSRVAKLLIDEFDTIFGPDTPALFQSQSPPPMSRPNNKVISERIVTRTPPPAKAVDSMKPFALQRSYTTLDKTTLEAVYFNDDHPKKSSINSLLDDDDVVAIDDDDDDEHISSQDAADSADTDGNESDVLARRAMHLFPLTPKHSVDLFWGDSRITADNYLRGRENGYYKRKAANHKKRQAPQPPDGRSPKSHSKVVRSNSVNQVRGVDEFVFKPMQWHRSKSTTRLNIATSNGLGNGGGSSGGGSATTDDEIQMTILPSEDYGQILVENYYMESGAVMPQASPNPPDYDETISRQRILRYYRRPENSTSSSSASPRHYQDASPLNAHQMASLSINDNNNSYRIMGKSSDFVSPPPLPPKERPPLPPKQRYTQRLSSSSINDNTYANMTPFYARFEDEEDLYTAYSVGIDDPPNLPPKEFKSNSSASSSLSTAATQTLSMCDAETQTNEDDFYVLYQDDEDVLSFRDEPSFEQSVDVVLLPEERNALFAGGVSPLESPRPSNLTVAMPKWSSSPRQYQHTPVHRLYHSQIHQPMQPQQPQHPPHTPVTREAFPVDKIGWSVSQLRSLFNQSESADKNVQGYGSPSHSRDVTPSHGSHRLTAHVNKERTPNMYNASHYSDDHSDEESYV